jgi:hypothetical protein
VGTLVARGPWLIAALCLVAGPGRAQLTEADTLAFGWKATAAGSWLSGNIDRLVLLSSAEVARVRPTWAFRSANTHQLGYWGSLNTENDLLARQFAYLYPHRRIYPYAMLWLETNKRQAMDFRLQAGPGLTVVVVRRPGHVVKVSGTLTYEHAWFARATFTDPDYAGRQAFGLVRGSWRVFGQHTAGARHLRLRYEVWGQHAFQDAANYRLRAEAALEYTFHRLLAFRLGVVHQYEAITLAGLKPRDTFATIGLTIGNF